MATTSFFSEGNNTTVDPQDFLELVASVADLNDKVTENNQIAEDRALQALQMVGDAQILVDSTSHLIEDAKTATGANKDAAAASAAAAAASAVAAAASKDLAAQSVLDATGQANAAAASVTAAAAQVTAAQGYANSAANQIPLAAAQVTLATNQVSAAAAQVTLAQNQVTLAAGRATDAQTSATASATSATASAASATSAQGYAQQAQNYAQAATTGQIQADWNITDNTSKAYIWNKPTIPVAYTDAKARLAIAVSGSLTYNNTTGVISYTAPVLATVATSGAYADLTGKPTIPTNNNQLTNGAGFITSAAIPVTSVAGRTGVIALTKADVGLANVDNTTDLSKPISTAVQAALDAKQNNGAGLSLAMVHTNSLYF